MRLFQLGFFTIGTLALSAQNGIKPIAEWNFNKPVGSTSSAIRLRNVFPAEDRFGNLNHAIYLQGNKKSYINLGSNKILNTEKGTISIWFNMHGLMGTGKGVESNPLLHTRSYSFDHCNDAFYLGIDMNTHRLNGATLNDSIHFLSLYSQKAVSMARWHHAVLVYDDDSVGLYYDGVLQHRAEKKFRTHLLGGDSIIIGVRVSDKNERYFLGNVDDIMIFDRPLSGSEVESLFKSPDPNRNRVVMRYLLVVLSIALAVLLLIWLIRKRVNTLVRRRLKQLTVEQRLSEQEIRILKAQMNPHFIFNALNTLHHFILKKNNDAAESYLTKFSMLIRKLLESNTSDQLQLQQEISILKDYLEIESLRFGKVFSYSLEIDPEVDSARIYIPHFMVQPFVENAIWHGLLPKKGEKKLSISFSHKNDQALRCVVQDNGVGRLVSAAKRTVHTKKSFGIEFVRNRLEMMGKIKKQNYELLISDYENETGTRVELDIPITKT